MGGMKKKKQMAPASPVSLIAFFDAVLDFARSRACARCCRKSFGFARRFTTLLHSPLHGSLSQMRLKMLAKPRPIKADAENKNNVSGKFRKHLLERFRQQRHLSAQTGRQATNSKCDEQNYACLRRICVIYVFFNSILPRLPHNNTAKSKISPLNGLQFSGKKV